MNGKPANASGKFANYSEKTNDINGRSGSVAVPGRVPISQAPKTLGLQTPGRGGLDIPRLSAASANRLLPEDLQDAARMVGRLSPYHGDPERFVLRREEPSNCSSPWFAERGGQHEPVA